MKPSQHIFNVKFQVDTKQIKKITEQPIAIEYQTALGYP